MRNKPLAVLWTLVIAGLVGVGFAGADPSHYTETLPPAVTNGAMPIANGYDWSLTTNSTSPVGQFKGITDTGVFTQAGTYTQASGSMTLTGVTVAISSAVIAPLNLSLTQVQTSTPSFVGQTIFCNNCAASGGAGTLCVSTTTVSPGAGNDFVLSTGTVCK